METLSCVALQRLSVLPNQAQNKDPKHWNSIIKHQTKLKNDQAILSAYTHMESLGILPDKATLPLVLKACARLNAIEEGKKIHRKIRSTDLVDDVRVRTSLVDLYCKCGVLEDARYLFDEMGDRDVILWNAMISGYVGMGCNEEALTLFLEMRKESLRPNSGTIVALLMACGELLQLRMGREVQGYCLRNGLFETDARVGTAFIGFYLRFDVRFSRITFDLMNLRNVVSWNAMISGYLEVGDCLKALKLFVQMLMDEIEFDCVTILSVIQACAEFGYLKLGMQIHQLSIKYRLSEDLFLVTALIIMYSKNGSLEFACELFDSVSDRDVALWNSMISSYIEFGFYDEAIHFFIRMQTEGIKEDGRTLVIMLSMCAELANGLRMGKSLHAYGVKGGMTIDVSLGNALLSMYADQRHVDNAQKVFNEMRALDVISWNTLILTFAQNNLRGEAMELFSRMRKLEVTPNSHTMVAILASCEDETSLNIGRSIHGFVIRRNIEWNLSLNTALTDMYLDCGNEATARKLFDGCPEKDVISWNALITTYIKNNQAHKALLLLNRMISEVEPNSITIINLLSACTSLANLLQGQCLHAYILRRMSSLGSDLSLANAFITMYARCGSMQKAEKFFETLPRRNIITWNAMIAGYGAQGRAYEAMITFSQMLEDGFQPNGVTFVSLLSACSHSGFVEKGLQLFQSMIQDFGITPELNHYGCVVDLLGRGGYIEEALEFINSMPIEPDASVWRALLSACRDYSSVKLAENIFEQLVKLEPLNEGNYVLLSNIYAAAGLWSEVRQLRKRIKEKGLIKSPGLSWIVVGNQIHYFTAGDNSHPKSDKIYGTVNSLLPSMKETGYVPDLQWILHEEVS